MIRHAESRETISDREKEIIICLVQGMSNKEIANHLYISVNTVITHRRNIARKLQIHSVAGLTIYAIANNLIDKSCFTQVWMNGCWLYYLFSPWEWRSNDELSHQLFWYYIEENKKNHLWCLSFRSCFAQKPFLHPTTTNFIRPKTTNFIHRITRYQGFVLIFPFVSYKSQRLIKRVRLVLTNRPTGRLVNTSLTLYIKGSKRPVRHKGGFLCFLLHNSANN